MARNEEKAQSMLHRYLRSKETDSKPKRRPYRATLCDDVDEAEKWLRQVIREIQTGVSDIQNDTLEETRVRDLNDGLNRLLKERRAWERRIRALGGDVPGDTGTSELGRGRKRNARGAPKSDAPGGDNVIEVEGYFYFGAARSLPGVADIVQRAQQEARGGADDGDDGSDAEPEGGVTAAGRRLNSSYFGEGERGAVRNDARKAEEVLRARAVKEWEDGGGEKADVPWDDSFKQFVGQRPVLDDDGAQMRALLLERRKAEALEHLQMSSRSKG